MVLHGQNSRADINKDLAHNINHQGLLRRIRVHVIIGTILPQSIASGKQHSATCMQSGHLPGLVAPEIIIRIFNINGADFSFRTHQHCQLCPIAEAANAAMKIIGAILFGT